MSKPFHPNDVLLDLLQYRITSGALADRHECSSYQIRAIMNRHKKDGLVVAIPLCGDVNFWELTESGKALAESMQTPAATAP